MSNEAPSAFPDLYRVWRDLVRQGYSVTTDQAVGLPEKFRENFHQAYFSDHALRHDDGDWPRDRKRARDVIHYKWSGDELGLEEHRTIAITDRAGIKGERLHKRIEILADREARELVQTLLSLVPPDRRHRDGTFGVNFFRTYTDVVTRPHRDDEEFIIIYVLRRDGEGARTYLYESSGLKSGWASSAPVLDRQLNPGEMIIFEDKKFLHGATPLEDPPGGKAMRDVLVCTVDYASTYLA